jgi:hypothetical protein
MKRFPEPACSPEVTFPKIPCSFSILVLVCHVVICGGEKAEMCVMLARRKKKELVFLAAGIWRLAAQIAREVDLLLNLAKSPVIFTGLLLVVLFVLI